VRDAARLHFLCGHRALEECARSLRRQEEIVRRLTCHPDEIAGKLERLQQEPRGLRKQVQELQRELAAQRAAAWVGTAPRLLGFPLVVHAVEPCEPELLRATAEALVARDAIALLGCGGARAQLLFSCPGDARLDLRGPMQAACERVAGRGGGSKQRQQGAGERPEALEEALAAARATLLAGLGASDFDNPSAPT
jgi:alanyl-tRNA synthetase